MAERICETPGCTNLGVKRDNGKGRKPSCYRCASSPEGMARRKAARPAQNRASRSKAAAGYAAQLLRGERIRSYSCHHAGMRHILGLAKGNPLTVSRICPDGCPSSWLGVQHRGGTAHPYRLCIPAHYIAEPRAANLARQG